MRNPWNFVSLLYLIFLQINFQKINCQFFDPKVNDAVYLNSIQNDVVEQVQETKSELMEEAKLVQILTKNYIAASLKQNLFKALRVLAEKELALDAMTMQERPRQPRQQEPPEEEDEETTTRRPASMILPQVASLIKAVFGGNINLTSYVESASQFLPKPISMQLVGVVKLLANNNGQPSTTTAISTTTTTIASSSSSKKPKSTTTTTTAQYEYDEDVKEVSSSPSTTIKVSSSKPQRVRKSTTVKDVSTTEEKETTQKTKATSTTQETTTEEEEEEEEESPDNVNNPIFTKQNPAVKQRQLNSILGSISNAFDNLFGSNSNDTSNSTSTTTTTEPTSSRPERVTNKNRPNSGFDDDKTGMAQKMGGIDLIHLAKEVGSGIEDVLKVIPDIFSDGARQAYLLLNSVTKLFIKLDQPDS